MTKDEIIDHIARDKKYLAMCQYITGKNSSIHSEDLYQELFLFLLAIPECRLQEIFNSNMDNYYFIMGVRQYRGKTSRFYKTFIKPNEVLNQHCDDIAAFYDFTPIDPDLLKKLNRAMDELHFVDSALLRLYSDGKTLKQISKESGVPRRSVEKIIQSARQNVQCKVKRYKRTER